MLKQIVQNNYIMKISRYQIGALLTRSFNGATRLTAAYLSLFKFVQDIYKIIHEWRKKNIWHLRLEHFRACKFLPWRP